MRLLLDTHALIWWFAVSERLSLPANHAISDETNDVLVSAASAWEIATKHRLGKLPEAAAIALDLLVAIAPASVLKNCLSPWTTPRAPGLCRSSTATPSTGCSSPRRWPATSHSYPMNRSSTATASGGCGELPTYCRDGGVIVSHPPPLRSPPLLAHRARRLGRFVSGFKLPG